MSEDFTIVPLTNGHFRAARNVMRDQVQTYQSATFRTEREAREWIDHQGKAPPVPRIVYTVTPTDEGTYRVTLLRSDQGAQEMLGEFATADDANTFIGLMSALDAGQSHGSK